MRSSQGLSFIAAAMFFATGARGAVFRVDIDSPEGGDGSSWELAFNDLQAAIDAAIANGDSDSDFIRVAEGTYLPSPDDENDREESFRLPINTIIEGGYAGYGEPDPDARSINDYPTVLSGDIGTPGLTTDNSYHVVVNVPGVIEDTQLDGFTIRDGNASQVNPPHDGRGGGVSLIDCYPIISNCTFTENAAPGVSGGGGLALEFDDDDVFTEGVHYLRLEHCTFQDNSALNRGGALLVYNQFNRPGSGGVAVIDCTLTGNEVTSSTGCGGTVHVEIEEGIPFSFASDIHLVNCRVTGNSAQENGGGVSVEVFKPSKLTLVNCLVANNSVPLNGGGVAVDSAELRVYDCTFADNQASNLGGGLHAFDQRHDATAEIYNSIFWGDSAPNGGAEVFLNMSSLSDSIVKVCSIENGIGGIGGEDFVTEDIFEEPPDFVGDGDYSLNGTSGLIDQGDNTLLPADKFDVDGNGNPAEAIPLDNAGLDRVFCATVDIGAFEWHQVDGCPEDLGGNGVVDYDDINRVIAAWGNLGGAEDLDGSGTVDFGDIVRILRSWGACSGCGPGPDSIAYVFATMGLEYPADWLAALDIMGTGTQAEQDNCACWMDHYYRVHFLNLCLCSPNCPDADPFGGH